MDNFRINSRLKVANHLIFAAAQFDLSAYYQKYKNVFDKKGLSINDLWKIFTQDPSVSNLNLEAFIFDEGYFTSWLNNQLKTNWEKLKSDSQVDALKITLQKYLDLKSSEGLQEISKYDVNTLEAALLPLGGTSYNLKQELNQQEISYETLCDNEKISVFKANNWKTSIYFGDQAYNKEYPDTRWCVTWPTESGKEFFTEYSQNGNSYFVFDKTTNQWFAYFGEEFQNILNDRSAMNDLSIFEDLDQKSGDLLRSIIPIDLFFEEDITFSETEMINFLDSGYKMSAQHLNTAIKSGNENLVNKLLEMGVQPDSDSLSYAIESGNENIINTLKQVMNVNE